LLCAGYFREILGPFLNNVANGDDFRLLYALQGLYMDAFSHPTATDDTDLDFFRHNMPPVSARIRRLFYLII
jgi:hypothetical protein